jgi:tRNA-splicing ligase RtcB (3'-phosphate/5'-hydroxy nucleic acid ligase)
MYQLSDRIVAFIPEHEIEPQALLQIKNTATLPFLFKHVAVMPDTHYGKGSTVGTVLATQEAVVPAAVGVDIGCGMIAVRTSLHADQVAGKLHDLRLGIERRIPMSAGKFNSKILATARPRIETLRELQGADSATRISPNWPEQLGTLGGGNHFIEICLDTNDAVWVTLHSGSRGVGNKIGSLYIKKAQAHMQKWRISLPDRDLAYLPESEEDFGNYIRDLRWAQHFALLNREEMLDRTMMELSAIVLGSHERAAELELERINCHHNFTQVEKHFGHNVWITRKGAIRADVGVMGMIPGSMGTRSYIVSGLGNRMSFMSAPHGAGRRMSRGAAKRAFTMKDFDTAMSGIEHRRSDVLIDELPQAYKDIDHVMENAKELVKIEATLKQILNVKGD